MSWLCSGGLVCLFCLGGSCCELLVAGWFVGSCLILVVSVETFLVLVDVVCGFFAFGFLGLLVDFALNCCFGCLVLAYDS